MLKNLHEKYSPLFFLAALGAGGISVTFFLYLMFLVPHPDTPMVTFNHLYAVLTGDNGWYAFGVGLAMLLIAAFATLHVRLLLWNIREYGLFKRTEAFKAMVNTNAEVTLMAVPLTYAMSINVSFILGAVFVPGLWDVVEYLFPLSLIAFSAVGIYAARIFLDYFSRMLISGSFSFEENNNLSQMLAIFAFAMIGVGFAAPAAMSHTPVINVMGMMGSLLFVSFALILSAVYFVLGFKSMLRQGVAKPATPSLWIAIPILTLLGITVVRFTMGLDHNFDTPASMPVLFVVIAMIFAMQLVFGMVGYAVMKRVGYFDDFVSGDQSHVGSYSLICPGVALFVFAMFLVAFGLVQNGIVDKYSIGHLALFAPLVLLQLKTIQVYFRLNRKLLKPAPVTNA